MLATFEQTEAYARLYFGRGNSNVSYFAASEDGGGCILVVEPGFHTWPWEYEANKESVRQVVLAEAAVRLGTDVSQVLATTFARLAAIADPDVPEKYRIALRSRSRRGFR